MLIIDAPFPDCISFGARSEPEWSTEMVGTVAGFEYANQNWANNRHRYDVSLAVRTTTDYALVRSHFNMVRGRALGFLFEDPVDHAATATQGITAAASGGGYQLQKRYGTGAYAYDRKITRPVSTGLVIYRTRTAVTTNVTGSATLNTATGTFTITGHVEGDVYTWAGDFMVPCRYDTDRLPTAIVNKQPSATGELLVVCDSIPLLEVRE